MIKQQRYLIAMERPQRIPGILLIFRMVIWIRYGYCISLIYGIGVPLFSSLAHSSLIGMGLGFSESMTQFSIYSMDMAKPMSTTLWIWQHYLPNPYQINRISLLWCTPTRHCSNNHHKMKTVQSVVYNYQHYGQEANTCLAVERRFAVDVRNELVDHYVPFVELQHLKQRNR